MPRATARIFYWERTLAYLTAAAAVASLDRGTDPGDLVYFVHRGEQLLSGGWASTFADPMLQSGPLQLVVFGAVRNVAALAFVVELGTAALLLFVLGRLGVGSSGGEATHEPEGQPLTSNSSTRLVESK